MTRLSTVYIACPHCGKEYSRTYATTFHMGNMTVWSDGYSSGLLLFRNSRYFRCSCLRIIWVSDMPEVQDEVSEVAPRPQRRWFWPKREPIKPSRRSWPYPPDIPDVDPDTFIAALESLRDGDIERERILRRDLRFHLNTPYRRDKPIVGPGMDIVSMAFRKSFEKENLIRLEQIAAANGSHLERADVLREQGHFAEAQAALVAATGDAAQLQMYRDRIHARCTKPFIVRDDDNFFS